MRGDKLAQGASSAQFPAAPVITQSEWDEMWLDVDVEAYKKKDAAKEAAKEGSDDTK
jgi:hypothetical protein